jgi:hypothetical protein
MKAISDMSISGVSSSVKVTGVLSWMEADRIRDPQVEIPEG